MTGEADQTVKAQRFKCDNCGAEQAYDASIGKLKCAHCGAARDVPIGTGTVVEYDFFQGLTLAPKGLAAGSGTRASKCQECGANVVFADGSTATKCTFCALAAGTTATIADATTAAKRDLNRVIVFILLIRGCKAWTWCWEVSRTLSARTWRSNCP